VTVTASPAAVSLEPFTETSTVVRAYFSAFSTRLATI